jgi:hypothetical protein
MVGSGRRIEIQSGGLNLSGEKEMCFTLAIFK